MRVLVTGGCGFIGSHIVDILFRDYPGVKVLNVDKITYAADEANVQSRHNANYVLAKVDICDKKALEQVWSAFDPEYVIHAAAESHVDRANDSAQIFIDSNITGTLNLLELARTHGKSLINFHYVSTDEVYGERHLYPFRENDELNPRNAYAASKASAEHLVEAYTETHGLTTSVTRGCNTYGPRQYREKFIPTVIGSILMGTSIPVYGNGEQEREWMYVEDHARAILNIALSKDQLWRSWAFNVGPGTTLKNIEMIKMIGETMGSEPLIGYVTDRKGHDRRYGMDSTLIKDYGWEPVWALKEGLVATVEWYRQAVDKG